MLELTFVKDWYKRDTFYLVDDQLFIGVLCKTKIQTCSYTMIFDHILAWIKYLIFFILTINYIFNKLGFTTIFGPIIFNVGDWIYWFSNCGLIFGRYYAVQNLEWFWKGALWVCVRVEWMLRSQLSLLFWQIGRFEGV